MIVDLPISKIGKGMDLFEKWLLIEIVQTNDVARMCVTYKLAICFCCSNSGEIFGCAQVFRNAEKNVKATMIHHAIY